MTAIFAAAVSIMVMVGVLEAVKLVTCAWLASHWRRLTTTPRRSHSALSWPSRAVADLGSHIAPLNAVMKAITRGYSKKQP